MTHATPKNDAPEHVVTDPMCLRYVEPSWLRRKYDRARGLVCPVCEAYPLWEPPRVIPPGLSASSARHRERAGMSGLTQSDLDVLADWWEADDSDPSRTLVAAVEAIVAARLASVEALADEWEAEGESLIKNAHSGRDVHEGSTMVSLADLLRGALGSDAHTEQKGTGR